MTDERIVRNALNNYITSVHTRCEATAALDRMAARIAELERWNAERNERNEARGAQ